MELTQQSIKKRTYPLLENIKHFLIQWRVVILILGSIFLGVFEIIEHPDFLTNNSSYFFIELGSYYTLIVITAVMVEVTIKAVIAKNRTIDILDARHSLSMKLIAAKDWDEVVTRVVQYPASILHISATLLMVLNQDGDNFVVERSWIDPSEDIEFSSQTISRDTCCTDDITTLAPNVHMIDSEKIAKIINGKRMCYHIIINYGDLPIGMFYLILPKYKQLTQERVQLLSNTAEEIGIGLNAAKQRQLQQAIEVANATTNERLEIARDLHDTLGQNIGYLHLKLDQILTMGKKQALVSLYDELEQLRDLSNESYELIRTTLVILHQKSDHRISELFKAHAANISKRAELSFSIEENGVPHSIPPSNLRQLLFAYKETLYNIEKHSGARQIKVNLTWTETHLGVTIWDDGRGFDQNDATENGHYGLKIIQERINSLGGKTEINSSPGQGAEVKFGIPITMPPNDKIPKSDTEI